ncbi:MAG TPA: hypothetical protein VIM79_06155 [Niastella sp.]
MIKNILLSGLLLAITVVFLSGCKKDKISPTQAELTANELKSVIERNSIMRVYPVRINEPIPTPFPANGGTTWSFSNGFIYINSSSFYDSYNLSYLVRYGISNVPLSNGTSDKALLLYMEQ